MYTIHSKEHITAPSGIFCSLVSNNQIWEMHLHDGFYEIMVIFNGTLYHNAEGFTRLMCAGDVAFMPSSTAHSLFGASKDLCFLNLSILPITISQAMRYLGLPDIPQKVSFFHISQEVIDFLMWNYSSYHLSTDPTLTTACERNALGILLPYCQSTGGVYDWFDVLLTQMKKRENFQLGILQMQSLAYCSPSHLSRVCKMRTGMTPTQFIERTRIEYAEQLLLYTDNSIRDIGLECGFNNHGYFYRSFERITGMTPKQYRDSAANRDNPFQETAAHS